MKRTDTGTLKKIDGHKKSEPGDRRQRSQQTNPTKRGRCESSTPYMTVPEAGMSSESAPMPAPVPGPSGTVFSVKKLLPSASTDTHGSVHEDEQLDFSVATPDEGIGGIGVGCTTASRGDAAGGGNDVDEVGCGSLRFVSSSSSSFCCSCKTTWMFFL